MASAEKIDPQVLGQLQEQQRERQRPSPEVLEELRQQKRLREGDYPATTIPGALQAAVGVGENVASMVTGFFSAVPGLVAGMRAANQDAVDAYTDTVMKTGSHELAAEKANEVEPDWDKYPEAFVEQAEKTTTPLITKKGKRYGEAIQNTYNEYIEEKWGGYVGDLVSEGRITPEEGAYYRTSADALLMGLFMRGASYARGLGKKAAEAKYRKVNIDGLEGEYMAGGKPGTSAQVGRGSTVEGEVIRPRVGEQKKLPAPDRAVAAEVRNALERGVPVRLIESAVKDAKTPEVAAGNIAKLEFKPTEAPADQPNIFKNRQAGAVDPEVFREGIAKLARPGVMTAKTVADVGHALARQVAFKHVTDIRKINSPTAKMLADRIMPLEDSTIPLGAGFHELISLREGDFLQRVENIAEPLRRHVINKNATKSLRLVALPKRINEAIYEGMDSGLVREDLVPAVKALRAILDDIHKYQAEAGVDVGYLEDYMPRMWDDKKIARLESGKKKGGKFTKYLMEEEGLTFDVAQDVIATLTHEEGFMDFLADTGGRLQEGMDFSEWSRAHRVGGGPAKPGFIKQRKLKGEFSKAKDFLITDVEAVLTNYITRAVNHAEYARIAGQGEGKLNHLVRQIIEEQEFSRTEGGKLKASSPHETAQEIYDVFDALQHRFHSIKNPAVRRASRAMAGFEVINKLALVTLAQFPETMMPAAKYRVATAPKALPGVPIPLKSYAVGMMDAVWNAGSAASVVLTGKRVIPKSEIRKHLENIGVVYQSALQSSASRMAGPVGVITNRTIRGFMLEQFTNFQRTITYDTIQSMIRENARYLAKGLAQGKREKMYRQELTELGLNPDEVIQWYRDGMPKDHPISKKFDVGLVRGIDTTTIMPKAANAPRMYNDPRWQLITLFTRFFTVFGNTVMKNLGKKFVSGDVTNTRKLGSIGALMSAVAIAYYTQFLREDITGYQLREEDDPMRIVDAYDRAGLTAMFTRLYPLFSPYRYGEGSKWVAGLLGPAASDVAGGIEAAKGSNEQLARWMAKMTPIMTVTPESEDIMYEFYLEMIEATGLPDRK